tara:strand:- start:1010 stop:1708 length:699 start_codon:yes stop_codon:yes gene_type:complete
MVSNFYCKDCDKTFSFTTSGQKDKKLMENHLNTKTHKANHIRAIMNDNSQKQKRNYTDNTDKYECKVCCKDDKKVFMLSKKYIIDRHNDSKSHKKNAENYINNDIDYEPNQIDKYFCDDCKKEVCQNTIYYIKRHKDSIKHQDAVKEKIFGISKTKLHRKSKKQTDEERQDINCKFCKKLLKNITDDEYDIHNDTPSCKNARYIYEKTIWDAENGDGSYDEMRRNVGNILFN